ncbi:MAG TPA: 50S ribosomal protein L20 [Candidatus Saccharimonadales bacterium]|nr:50S ribosomal protein L20 [Candidatus Saccharimonadales bacterium]
MSRVKSGKVTRQRHKRVFKQTKGCYGQRKNVFRRAKETLLRALAYAFKGRKLHKRSMRALFITRINAAVRPHGYSYSAFIPALKKAHVQLNRKMLSQLAIFEPTVFQKVVETVRS